MSGRLIARLGARWRADQRGITLPTVLVLMMLTSILMATLLVTSSTGVLTVSNAVSRQRDVRAGQAVSTGETCCPNGGAVPAGGFMHCTTLEPGTGCPSPVGVLLGRAGEVAPARREDPSVRERYAVLQHQLAEAAEIAQACADAEPAYLQVAAGGAPFVYLAPGDARAHP